MYIPPSPHTPLLIHGTPCPPRASPVTDWNQVDKCGAGLCGATPMVDLWEQDRGKPGTAPGPGGGYLSQPARTLNNSQSCTQANQHAGCRFEDDELLNRAKFVVTAHAALGNTAPLFLFWATHACHGPREVPQATLDEFAFIDCKARRTYHALANYLDGMVGEMVTTLQDKGMWQNTLLVFSADNGGDDQANNYPQRGAKFSNWQGGVHVAAFVSGGALPTARRGIKLAGLATIWDMLPTLGVLGGLTDSAARTDALAEAAGLPAVDGVSQWGYWSGAVAQPPRTEVAIGGELGNENGAPSGVRFTGPTASDTGVEALVSSEPGAAIGDPPTLFKYMLGTFHFDHCTGPVFPSPNSTGFSANNSEWNVVRNCSVGCLFDLDADPAERTNVAADRVAVAAKLHARLLQINATAFTPDRGPPDMQRGCVVALGRYGGFWGPFLDLD